MKIAFWGPESGKCTPTSCLNSVASDIAMNRKMQSCIISANPNNRVQASYLALRSEEDFVSSASSSGVDALIRFARGSMLNDYNITNVALDASPFLHYFVSSQNKNKALFEKTFCDYYDEIIHALDQKYQLVFIDTKGGYSQFNQKIFATSDIVVICMNQDKDVIDRMFARCDFTGKNCLFVLSNYDSNVSMSVKNFRNYQKSVTSKNSGVIAHCSDFADAVNNSCLYRWMSSQKRTLKQDAVQQYLRSVSDVSAKVIKLLGVGGA